MITREIITKELSEYHIVMTAKKNSNGATAMDDTAYKIIVNIIFNKLENKNNE